MVLFTAANEPSRAERLEGYIKGIADDNMTSLRLLYEETSAGVYSFALSMLKSREDAEDTLQDVYLSVHKSAAFYRAIGRPMEWLMTITRNLCITKLRQRQKTQPLNPADEPIDYLGLSGSDDRIALNEALTKLSDEERRIVVLHAVAGLKHREIAAVLDVPISTVTNKYRRALKKLRKHLTEGGAFDGKAQQ